MGTICIYYPGWGKYYCDLSYSHLLYGYFKIYDNDVASPTTRPSKTLNVSNFFYDLPVLFKRNLLVFELMSSIQQLPCI